MTRGITRTKDVSANVFFAPPIVLDARYHEGVTATWIAPDGTPREFWCGFEVDVTLRQIIVVRPLKVGTWELGYRVFNGSHLGSCVVRRIPGCTPAASVEIPVALAESLSVHLERDGVTTLLDLDGLRVEVF